MVAWEPEDEDQVNQWFQLFATYGYAHAAGALVAFNGDPSLFHVFASSSTGKYSHSDFGANNTITPSVTTVTLLGEELLVTFALISGDSTNFQLSIHTREARGVLSLRTIALIPLFNPSQFGNRITGVYAAPIGEFDLEVMLGGTTSTYLRIVLHLTHSMEVDKILSYTPILLPGITAGAQSYSFTNQHVLAVSAVYSSVVATLYANYTMPTQLWSLPVGVTNPNAITGSEGLGAAWHCDPSSCYGVAMWSYDRKVFVTTITASASGNAPQVVGDKVPVLLGVGVTPKVALLDQDTTGSSPYFNPSDRSPVLLATYGYSFCYNDILIDDDTFTVMGRKICDLQNTSNTEVLPNPVQSYVFTTFDTLQREIMPLTLGHGDQMRNGIATSCSDTMFHGTFDEGFDAAPLLLPRRSDDVDIQAGGYLGLASLTSLTIPSLSICGRPNPRGGRAMVDTFPLFGFYNYP